MLATTIQHSNTTPHHQSRATPQKRAVSKPNSVSAVPLDRAQNPDPINVCCAPSRRHYSHRLLHGLTFRYGYLVTTSSQSPIPPSTTPSHKGLGHGLRVLPTFMT